jgi:hypothetical protein
MIYKNNIKLQDENDDAMLSLVSCQLSCCDQITSKESTPKERGFETNLELRGQAPSVKVPTTPAIQTKAFGP